MDKRLFRTGQREDAASPERLDEVVRVASPLSTLFTLFLLFGLACGTVWAFAGTVTTRVHGEGLILFEGARNEQVTAAGAGRVEAVLVEPGDVIAAGDVVARMVNRPTRRRLAEAERQLRELESDLESLRAARDRDLAAFDRVSRRRREALESRVAQGERLVDALRSRLSANEDLFERGLVNSAVVSDLRTELFQALQDVETARSELTRLDLDREERAGTWRGRIVTAEQAVSRQRARVREREVEAEVAEVVTAPADGEVVEVLVGEGSAVSTGTPVITVTEPGARLSTLAFMPALRAKAVAEGMDALVSPSTVRREEFGSMRGEVAFVSRFPLSSEALSARLQNPDLVRTFTQGGPPLLVRIDFARDERTGGYAWTSNAEPPVEITPGTLASVSVVTRTQRPVTLLLPALRQLLGVS